MAPAACAAGPRRCVSITTTSACGGGAGSRSSGSSALPRSPENSTRASPPPSVQFQQNAGRAEDVAGVDEGRAHAVGELQRLIVARRPAEIVEDVQASRMRVERRAIGSALRLPRAWAILARVARVLFLQMRGIEHHQPGQFARRRRGDDLAAKAALVRAAAGVRSGRDGHGSAAG